MVTCQRGKRNITHRGHGAHPYTLVLRTLAVSPGPRKMSIGLHHQRATRIPSGRNFASRRWPRAQANHAVVSTHKQQGGCSESRTEDVLAQLKNLRPHLLSMQGRSTPSSYLYRASSPQFLNDVDGRSKLCQTVCVVLVPALGSYDEDGSRSASTEDEISPPISHSTRANIWRSLGKCLGCAKLVRGMARGSCFNSVDQFVFSACLGAFL